MKKLFASLIIICLLLPAFPASAYEIYESPKPVTVHVDGKYLASDTLPFIDNGRTLIPLRAAAEALGATVDWDQSTKTARLTKDQTTIIFTVDAKSYSVNGTPKSLDVPLQIKDGRIMLPMRAFAEALNVKVDWSPYSADVSIQTTSTTPEPPQLPKDTPQEIRWLVSKYYVDSDSKDPLVGSWSRTETTENDDILTTSYSYNFISKIGDNKYKSINIFRAFSKDLSGEKQDGGFVFVSEEDVERSGSDYTFYDNKKKIYYHAPPMGLGFPGYSIYQMQAEQLVKVSSTMIMNIDPPTETRNVYEPYNRF